MTHLLAGRFEGSDTSAAILEQFSDVQIEGVSWSLDAFGLDRIELTVPARSRVGAYQRYDEHLGQRLAVYGSDLHRPISGWITEARLVAGNRVRYVARGPGFRMEKTRIHRPFAPTSDIATVITSIVSEFMPYCTADTSHIAANAVTIGGWGVDSPEGSTPADAIRQLCDFSDANYLIRDFWLVDEPFNGTSLGGFVPYYQARTATVDAAWIVNTNDLKGADSLAARSLEDMRTVVSVYYGQISGTLTGVSGNTLTDSSATFISDSVRSGDVIENKTHGGTATIVSVDSETQLTVGDWRQKHSGVTTHDGGLYSLIDSGTNFTNVGAQVGDTIQNDTDRSTGTVTGITTTYETDDTLGITGGMSGPYGVNNGADERYKLFGSVQVGDEYAIRTLATNVETAVASVDYWEAEFAVSEDGMDADQALQYANALLISEPQQVEPFVIGALMVRDANGAKWPNWEMIAQAARSAKIADLYPSVATLTGTTDRRTVFYVTSMEWAGAEKSLRVTIDAADRRLDARLRRERILGSAGLF